VRTPKPTPTEVCRAIARRHAKTFYLSSWFLRPAKRRAIWAVYAFCRTADDIVDQASPAPERLAALDRWEAATFDAFAGRARDPVLIALAAAVARYGIPLGPAIALLRGARRDVTVQRYATYDELREYCDLVAGTVGLLTLPILGSHDPAAPTHAVALGRAMQMTNILRDVGDDARLGRVYLPAEDLQRFGCSEEEILAGTAFDERFVALMRFEIARVRALYARAEPGLAMLDRDARYTVAVALALYRGILDRIEANGYDVFGRRAFVPLRGKLLGALGVALAR
jgi:phytoene synthase